MSRPFLILYLVLNRRFQRLDQIDLFPAKAAIGLRIAPKMPIGRRALIDRLVKAQLLTNAARRQVHALIYSFFNRRIRDLAGAVGIHKDRQRARHANRIGKLQRAALCHARSHDVFRQIARGVGC